MNAAQLKKLARELSNAAWKAGAAEGDDSWRRQDRATDAQNAALLALCQAIDVALPALPAADTIILGTIETDEGSALSFTETSRKFALGMPEQTR
jgi:hypothetical protein